MKNKAFGIIIALFLMSGGIFFVKHQKDKNSMGENSHGVASSTSEVAHTGETGKMDSSAPASGHSADGSRSSTAGVADASHPSVPGSEHAAAPVEPAKPDSNCFAFEYQHHKEARNKDIEEFLDYSNAFPLLHKGVNEKSICVKVNQKPVAFKLVHSQKQDEVMVGSVVGPESVIRVSYCVNKAACSEACAVKSNHMMDDMMSDAGDEDDFKDSWGDSEAHNAQKKDLKAKVKEMRAVASENKDLQRSSIMRDWQTLSQKDWFCSKHK